MDENLLVSINKESKSTNSPLIYFNVEVRNNTAEPQPFKVDLATGEIISNNAQSYCVGIQRASLPGTEIPITTIDRGLFVTLTDGDVPVSREVQYLNRESKYGKNTVFSYQEIATCLSNAMKEANDNLTTPTALPPFVYFSPQTAIFYICLPIEYDEIQTPGTQYKLFYNTKLQSMFPNYETKFYGYNNGFQNFQIICDEGFGINLSAKSGGTNLRVPEGYVEVSQEYSAPYLLQKYIAVVFRSTKIGVQNEYIPPPNNSNQLAQNSTSGVSNSDAILTDVIPILDDSAGTRAGIYYAPPQVRWIPIQKNTIDRIDMNVTLRDTVGEEIDYYIPPYQTGKIKLVFGLEGYIQQ